MGLRTMLQKHPKTGVYYFRKRYPQDVAGEAGRAEFKRSLNTKIRKKADVLVVEAERDFNQQITFLRNKSLIPEKDMQGLRNLFERMNLITVGEPITLDTVRAARLDIHQRIEGLKGLMDIPSEQLQAQECIDELENVLFELPNFERMFEQPGFSPLENMEIFWGKIQEYGQKLSEALSQPTPIALPKPSLNRKEAKTLDYAYEAWKSVRNPSIQSATEWKRAVRLFTEYHGDMDLGHITKQHVKEFREAIRLIPSRLPREQLKLSLPELVKLEKKGLLKGTPRTAGAVNKLMVPCRLYLM